MYKTPLTRTLLTGNTSQKETLFAYSRVHVKPFVLCTITTRRLARNHSPVCPLPGTLCHLLHVCITRMTITLTMKRVTSYYHIPKVTVTHPSTYLLCKRAGWMRKRLYSMRRMIRRYQICKMEIRSPGRVNTYHMLTEISNPGESSSSFGCPFTEGFGDQERHDC